MLVLSLRRTVSSLITNPIRVIDTSTPRYRTLWAAGCWWFDRLELSVVPSNNVRKQWRNQFANKFAETLLTPDSHTRMEAVPSNLGAHDRVAILIEPRDGQYHLLKKTLQKVQRETGMQAVDMPDGCAMWIYVTHESIEVRMREKGVPSEQRLRLR